MTCARLDDGIWAPGFLEAYRKVEGVWSGFVRYTLGPDATHLGWFEQGGFGGTGQSGDWSGCSVTGSGPS